HLSAADGDQRGPGPAGHRPRHRRAEGEPLAMGMSTGGKPGAVKSDINVTPLVDVVLVLLIIFIVTMPVMMHTESLEVPRSADENELPDTSKQIIVTYRPDGTVILSDGQNDADDKKIQATALVDNVRDLLAAKTGDKVVFVDFCDHTPWSDVVQTM